MAILKKLRGVGGAALAAVAAAAADAGQVVVAPGNGVETNVPAIHGLVSVVANPGASGGGIVALDPASDFLGPLTNGCGTLVVSKTGAGQMPGSLGSGPSAAFGPGTMRYVGEAGGVIDRPVYGTVSATGAMVFDVQNDLELSSPLVNSLGGFVKTGPGVLSLTSAGAYDFGHGTKDAQGDPTSSNYQNSTRPGVPLAFNANGDAPAAGPVGGLVVADGTVVFGENGGTMNVRNNGLYVGSFTTADGAETAGVLDLRGGKTTVDTWLFVGYNNGSTTTSEEPLSSTLRLSGTARLVVNNDIAMGACQRAKGYFGDRLTYRSAPRVELHDNAYMSVSHFRMGYDAGSACTLLMDGSSSLDVWGNWYGQYASPGATNWIEVCENAVANFNSFFYGFRWTGSLYGDTTVYVHDGGTVGVTWVEITGNRHSTMRFLLDGGTLKSLYREAAGINTSGQWMKTPTNPTVNGECEIRIGEQGGAFLAANAGLVSRVGVVVMPMDGVAADGGVTIATNCADGAGFRFENTLSYTGPTRVLGGSMAMTGTVKVPESALEVGSAGLFIATNAAQTVASAAFAPGASLGLAPTLPLTVRGAATLDGFLNLRLFAARGSTNSLAAAGTYSLMTFAADGSSFDADDVAIANPAPGCAYDFTTETANGTTTLKVTVRAATTGANVWTATSGGAWGEASSWQGGVVPDAKGAEALFTQAAAAGGATVALGTTRTVGRMTIASASPYTLSGGAISFAAAGFVPSLEVTAGDQTIAGDVSVGTRGAEMNVSPGASLTLSGGLSGTGALALNRSESGGRVVLSGASIAPKVKTGSGVTEVPSLGFVRSPADFLLGPGTLRYTGGSCAIPGFTLATGSSRAAVFEVADADAAVDVGSIALDRGSFLKTGPGKMRLVGSGPFTFGEEFAGYRNDATEVYPETGDAPLHGTPSFGIARGEVEWGADGETISIPRLGVGQRLRRFYGENYGAKLTILGGETYVAGEAFVPYYGGDRATLPDGADAVLAVTGGKLVVDQRLFLGYNAHGEEQTLRPTLLVQDAEVDVAYSLRIAQHKSTADTTNRVSLVRATLRAADGATVHETNDAGNTTPVEIDVADGSLLDLGCSRLLFGSGAGPVSVAVRGGSTLRAMHIEGNGRANNVKVLFDGGTFQPVCPGYTVNLFDTTNIVIGAGGFTIDTSLWGLMNTNAAQKSYLNVPNATFSHDPALGAAADGGIRVTGGDTVHFRGGSKYLFTGPVVAEGAGLGLEWTSFKDVSVVLRAGGRVRTSTSVNAHTIRDLTLGVSGGAAEDPAILDISAGARSYWLVTGEAAVEGPVTFLNHPAGNGACRETELILQAGTYTALVYRASCDADVDLANFVQPSKYYPNAKVAFAKVALPSGWGGLSGDWMAVTATVSGDVTRPAAATWAATERGGAWTDAESWEDGIRPQNAWGERVVFKPAAAANVPVDVDADVRMGQLTLDAAGSGKGYAVGGSGPIAFSMGSTGSDVDTTRGMIRVKGGEHVLTAPIESMGVLAIQAASGAVARVLSPIRSVFSTLCYNQEENSGTVELGGESTYSQQTRINCGTVKATKVANTGAASSFGAKGDVLFGPATIHYTGPAASTDRAFYQMVGRADEATTIRLDSDLTLTSPFGSYMDNLGSVNRGAFQKTGLGTLRLVARNATNVLGVNCPGVGNMNAAVPWPANGSSARNLCGAFVVDEGAMDIGAEGQVNLICTNSAAGEMHIGAADRGWAYATNVATLNMMGGQMLLKGEYMQLGRCMRRAGWDKCYAVYNQYAGEAVVNSLIFNYDLQYKNSSCQTFFNMYGGTFTLRGAFRFGQTANKEGYAEPHSTLNVYGGTFRHVSTNNGSNGGTRMGWLNDKTGAVRNKSCDATLNVYGGEYVDFRNVVMGLNNTRSDVNLHGGRLVVQNIVPGTRDGWQNFVGSDDSETYVYFNGGEFWPTGTNASYRTFEGFTAATVSTNGAIVNTTHFAGESYAFRQPLVHDAALGDVRDGGFTKDGAGTVVLSVTNAFTGPVTVKGGVLAPELADAIPAGLVLRDGGTLDLAVPGRAYVTDLSGDGLAVNGEIVASGTMAHGSTFTVDGLTLDGGRYAFDWEADEDAVFTVKGDFTATGVALDMALADGVAISVPFSRKVGVVHGRASVSGCRGANLNRTGIGMALHAKPGAADGTVDLWLETVPMGMMLIFR